MTTTRRLTLTPDKLHAMTDQQFKIAENRMRRLAERQGLALQKARRRDPMAPDHGTYRLVDTSNNTVAASSGWNAYGLRLYDIEQALLNRIECSRCDRADTLDAPDYLEWQQLPGGFEVCPACLTDEERAYRNRPAPPQEPISAAERAQLAERMEQMQRRLAGK